MAAKRVHQKIITKEKKLRGEYWPDITEEDLWLRTKNDGFTTIPRTMPLISQIMDDLSTGKPLSSTYLVLWCRVWETGLLKIENPRSYAFEAGFSGTRMETTWKSRMKILQELGFILTKSGASGDFHYVLILNPYKVIKKLHKEMKITRLDRYDTFIQRGIDVGAKEI